MIKGNCQFAKIICMLDCHKCIFLSGSHVQATQFEMYDDLDHICTVWYLVVNSAQLLVIHM